MNKNLSHEHLETIFASMGEGMLVVDKFLKILAVNPVAAQLLGTEERVLLGLDIRSQLNIWNGKEKLLDDSYPISQVLRNQFPIRVSEEEGYSFEPVHASVFPVEFTTAPLVENKNNTGAVMLFSDVSESRRLRSARTDFISIASHQLRTPLTPIRWFAKLLLAGEAGELNPQQQEFVRDIYDNNDRMVQLLNTLLQIVRVEDGRLKVEPKPSNLPELAKRVVVSLTPLAEPKGLSISVHEPKMSLPQVLIDEVIMWQVLQNLMTNAIRYSFPGSKVEVGFVHKGSYLEVYVQDHGIGIPKGLEAKIYEKFFRSPGASKMAPEGSGLGLALVKSLVNGWGGKIWHESEEGRGTTFHFTMPLSGMKPKAGDVSLSV